ncbi:MgtC/SapB family protein [Deinococcus sp. A31D244]|uniref:MgtC/SapB family protein n=1 Tax=Deinococcus sp. A31D244 TaxID=3397675 RepID=UPI0039E197EE
MADPLTDLYLLLRVLGACVLCGLIGWERELWQKSAGIRTQMLVGGSSALFVVLAEGLIIQFGGENSAVRFDLVGVLGAVVSGVAFLGAGTIFSSGKEQRRGLTTAASLLASAGIGVACGLTHYVLAVGSTLIFLFVLNTVGKIKSEMFNQDEDSQAE